MLPGINSVMPWNNQEVQFTQSSFSDKNLWFFSYIQIQILDARKTDRIETVQNNEYSQSFKSKDKEKSLITRQSSVFI